MAGKRRIHLHSLRTQMIVAVILAWLVPALILTQFIMTLLPRLQEMAQDALIGSADDAWAKVSDSMDTLITLSRDATYDGELLSAYTQREAGTLSDAEFVRVSRNYLERRYGREPLCRGAIYAADAAEGLTLYDRNGAEAMADYQALAAETLRSMRGEMDTRCLLLPAGEHLYLARNLLDTRMRPFGLLVLEIDRERLQAPLTAVAEQWHGTQWLETAGTPELSAPSGEKLTEGEGDTLVLTETSDSRDWTMTWYLTIPRDQVFGQVRQFRRLLIGLYVLLIPFLILISAYIHRRFTRPVTRLMEASRRIEQGEFGVTVPMKGEDELGALGRTFSHMSTHLKELVDRTYKEEIALRDARIQALQSRINPHFMNNALEDINWQARIEGSETISAMVSSLSILLNATMARKDRRLVTLREEMEVADAYIYFVQQRFGPELTVEKETESGAMDSILPLLTVQPLLENAVEHGIAPAGGGRITIQAKRAGECLQLGIINTGRGAEKEDRERIDAALRGCATDNHVGLANIVNRLQLIYGEKVVIRVETEQPGETGVFIDIPQELPAGREKT